MKFILARSLCYLLLLSTLASGEAMLQYFNTSWAEIEGKIPELAEAGYDSLWLPPPTKAGGGGSVGYDLFDPFDLGGKDQRGTVSTFYGTQAELLGLIETAHRFGIRIYLDNIMNHRGFDVPGYNESTPIDLYPGMLPEDFHLQVTQDGFYRNWGGINNYNDQWQVWNLSTSNLVDISQEPNGDFFNDNFGPNQGDRHAKIKFVRHPNNPEYYCYAPDGSYVGFGPGNGLTAQILAQNPGYYAEYVEDYLSRAARWEMDLTKADGLRLDAVKHVRADFFGASYGGDKDASTYGYLGQVQHQFDLSRGFVNTNLRATLFDTEVPRTNAMLFGEHLGGTPQQPYIDSGMRLLDNNLQSALIDNLSFGPLTGMDQPGGGGLPGGPGISVGFAQSADNGYMPKRGLAHAFLLTRAGLPVVYTDGNHHAGIMGEIGKAFPAISNTNFLGQFNDAALPNLLSIHNQFARGEQIPKWSDSSVCAYERRDKRENGSMSAADATTMLFMMNCNGASGQQRNIATSFPAGAYLWQYATGTTDSGDAMTGFYTTVPSNQSMGGVTIPKDGYFVFSWRTPEPSDLWSHNGGQPITILQNGASPATLTYLRMDGPDGDKNYNPNGVAAAVAGSFAYPCSVPRITDGSNLAFIARADASAENILLELDGGVDVNSQMGIGPLTGDLRDNKPGAATDVFLGYEQMQFASRQYGEKFANIDTSQNIFGSSGAGIYHAGGSYTGGSAGTNTYDTESGHVAAFLYHNPSSTTDLGASQYSDNGNTVTVWAKTNSVGGGYRMWFYYTTDASFPEGAGGVGIGTTRSTELHWDHNEGSDDWWKVSLTKPTGNLIYKLGVYQDSSGSQPAASIFPANADAVYRKKHGMTTFQITHFNAATKTLYPHNDYGATQAGLSQGFHVLRARQFLDRAGRAAIYSTVTQTFYYDTQLPQGEIIWPQHDGDTVSGSQYGVVVRTDPSVTEVWYHIDDSDASNDDVNTGSQGGNGAGFEPYIDANGNRQYDPGEVFTDLNGNGVWDNPITATWVKATAVTQSPGITASNAALTKEWRCNYNNIPASGSATIRLRLRKLSSGTYNDFGLSDVAGHFTTLTRTVSTRGPQYRMFMAYPQNDGDTVGPGYVMKVYYSPDIATGVSTSDLIKRFVIRISSSESASSANPFIQPQSAYSLGQEGGYGVLAYTLPNLYNGQPGFLHTLAVDYTPPSGGVPLAATRLVKAWPIAVIKDNIVNPPQFNADGSAYQIILPDVATPSAAQRSIPISVETDLEATAVAIHFTTGTVNGGDIVAAAGNPIVTDTTKVWNFAWTNVAVGDYQFSSTVTTASGSATANRSVSVIYRQGVAATSGRIDNDDDGLSDFIETTVIPLPTTQSESWTNDQVHLAMISGKTNALSPDSDGDGLSDGLELGWASAVTDTNIATDTNGDGTPNFQPDLDPPVYNTTDMASAPGDYSYFNPWSYNPNNSRTDQIAGSVTNPNKPDTDDDGLSDGVEDRSYLVTTGTGGVTNYQVVHNGRVDIGVPDAGGIVQVIAHPPTLYNTSRVDRAKVLARSPNAVWLETDPNSPDTTGCAMTDGAKDANHNGIVDLAIIDRNQTDSAGNFVVLATFSRFTQSVTVPRQGTNVTFRYADFCYPYLEVSGSSAGTTFTSTALDKNRLAAAFRPTGNVRSDGLDITWLETDPRLQSTSGDGLPDGWKVRFGLDPWDDGVIGHYNLHTGKIITNTDNGPNGSPAGDGINNLTKFLNGMDPHVSGQPTLPPPGTIQIGPGVATTVGAVTNNHHFTDWSADDLIALDYYDGDGPNYNGSDVYHAYDGWDTSRDMVAFYARDGGATSVGGDGKFYFRVDMNDLKALAEQGNLDIYVAINFGNPGTGEYNLPDQVDTGTAMRWQAVVACYQSDNGHIYLWDKTRTGAGAHSTAIGQDLSSFNVTVRDQNTANGFGKAYFNSDLDAVEFSISRQALFDAGWGGDATTLNYQVYTTKDGTQNSPTGAGDLGGRSDIRDAIRNDWIASDYWQDQVNISGAKSVLYAWVGLSGDNDRGKRIKVMSIIHGNQAIQPGSTIQNLINTGSGAGYYRPLDVHQAYQVPLTLHITPTLASAIQWAAADPASGHAWRDGPALNARIASLIGDGTIDLLGSTFSDHILSYFSKAFNRDNVALATEFLTIIYGHAPSGNVFWTPERVSDSGVLDKVHDLGYGFTFIDQMRHVLKWFGRASALGSDGYRLNRINGTTCLVINDGLGAYLLQNNDHGLPLVLRELLQHKARSGPNDQVVVLVNNWEDFTNKDAADAYDLNIAWLASHPWIELVTADQIATGQIDTAVPPTPGTPVGFGVVQRGTGLVLAQVSKDWIDHATEQSYDHWYIGSALEEGLSSKVFDIRAGAALPAAYGQIGSGSGLADSTWNSVAGISGPYGSLAKLARGTVHASVFETAFHNQAANDLSKFSSGAYINPDTTFQNMAAFAKFAQAQTRSAAIYSRVNAWAAAAATGSYTITAVAEAADVDQDGEPEYLLFNDRVFALFECLGGRMTHAWVRDILSGEVFQTVGNPLGYAGSETEEEGNVHLSTSTGQPALRTSGFKDWFAQTGGAGVGTNGYVNNVYAVTPAAGGTGWTFASSDSKITKTITLAPRSSRLAARYDLGAGVNTVYVRHGMSPNLYDLLVSGQANLSSVHDTTHGEVSVINRTPQQRTVRSFIKYGEGYTALYNNFAVDRDPNSGFDTLNMRNQAQTEQIEVAVTNGQTFAIAFETGPSVSISTAADAIPDWWKQQYALSITDPTVANQPAASGDGMTNGQKYVLGLDPTVIHPMGVTVTVGKDAQGRFSLQFSTLIDRIYQIYFAGDLAGPWTSAGAALSGTGGVVSWTDDGTATGTPPTSSDRRFYRVSIQYPPGQ